MARRRTPSRHRAPPRPNTATAGGGNGGSGVYPTSSNHLAGPGGSGGDAVASATTTAAAASSAGNLATAAAFGGSGATGGDTSGNRTATRWTGNGGGAAATATATASAINTAGAATATARADGGQGGSASPDTTFPPLTEIWQADGRDGADVAGSTARAVGTISAAAAVTENGGNGGSGAAPGRGGNSVIVNAVSGQSAGTLELSQTANGGAAGIGQLAGAATASGGNAVSDLTFVDQTSTYVQVALDALGGSGSQQITAPGQLPAVVGAGGAAEASGNITVTGQLSLTVSSNAALGGVEGGGNGTTLAVGAGGQRVAVVAEAAGGQSLTARGGSATAASTATATGAGNLATASSTAYGALSAAGIQSGDASATATATGDGGEADATATLDYARGAGTTGNVIAKATATLSGPGMSTSVAHAGDGGTLGSFDTTHQAVANVVRDPTAGAGGITAGAGGALLFDTEQGGGNYGAVAGSVTIDSNVRVANIDAAGLPADTPLVLDLAGATLVGTGVTGVTLTVQSGFSTPLEVSFTSGADALAYFSDHVINLGVVSDFPYLASGGIDIDMTVTVDAAGSGFYADPLFAAGSLETAPPCFAAGTRIATACGAVAVEDLRTGDEVVTRTGTASIVWIGHRRVQCNHHRAPETVFPVRIRAGTFGEAPIRDLLLSPDHAVWIDGALVPAGLLVDGDAIVQEACDRITYFHVELDRHDLLFAEGLETESYLDTGNRAQFANASLVSLHPAFAAGGIRQEPCAPMVLDGPQLEAIRKTYRSRAALRESALQASA